MGVLDHVGSFAAGAAVGACGASVALAAAGALAAGAGPVSAGVMKAVGIGIAVAGAAVGACSASVALAAAGAGALAAGADVEFKPNSAFAGGLAAFSAIAAMGFAVAPSVGVEAPAPEAAAPSATLIAEGNCEAIRSELPGSTGGMVKIVPPPGCTLKFAP